MSSFSEGPTLKIIIQSIELDRKATDNSFVKRIKTFITTFLLVAGLICFAPGTGSAEFLKLGPLTYASPSGKTFVIVTRALQGSGFFIIHFLQPQSVQNFNLADVELSNARTLFVSLNSKTGRYEKIVLLDGKNFIIIQM